MSKTQSFDPCLKEAIEEIKAVLRKHDAMATIILVSPTHLEWLHHIEASWSVMRYEGPGLLRFRSKKEDWPSKDAQDRATEASVHAVTTFFQFGRKLQHEMGQVLDQLRQHMRIAYEVWDN